MARANTATTGTTICASIRANGPTAMIFSLVFCNDWLLGFSLLFHSSLIMDFDEIVIWSFRRMGAAAFFYSSRTTEGRSTFVRIKWEDWSVDKLKTQDLFLFALLDLRMEDVWVGVVVDFVDDGWSQSRSRNEKEPSYGRSVGRRCAPCVSVFVLRVTVTDRPSLVSSFRVFLPPLFLLLSSTCFVRSWP